MLGVVFSREITSLTRQSWALPLVISPLVLLSILLILRWPIEGQVDIAGLRAMEIFRLFAYVVTGSVLLLTPAFPATSIVQERRRRTLALLLDTPLGGSAIYSGKLAASLVYILLPVWMTLPAAAACYALGAVEFMGQLVLLYSVLLLIALQYTVVALAISSRAATGASALRITYVIMLVLAFASLIPAWWSLRSQGDIPRLALWIRSLSPIPAMMEITGQSDELNLSAAIPSGESLRYCITVVITSVILATATISQLKQHLLERSRSAGIITDERRRSTQLWRRLLFLVDPQRRSSGIPNWMNPVLAKEFRSRRFGRSSWMLRMVAFCAVSSLAATLGVTTGAIQWSTESIAGAMVLLQAVLILVVTPSLASGLFSDEIESGGWSLLRMTPLSTWQIIVGKLMSATWPALLLLLATLPGYAVIMFIKPVMTRQVITVLLTLILTVALVIVLSAAISSCFARTARANITSYLVLLALFGGTLAIWAGRDAPFGPALVGTALSVNPVAAALSAIDAPGFESYHLLPECWYFVCALILVCIAVLAWRTHALSIPD